MDNTAFAGLYYELHLSFSRKNAGLFYKILLVLSVMMASRERVHTLLTAMYSGETRFPKLPNGEKASEYSVVAP